MEKTIRYSNKLRMDVLTYCCTCCCAAVHAKSEIVRDRFRQPSTNQIAVLTRATPAIYQSYLPDGRNHPAYTAQRTRTRTYSKYINIQHTAAHATIDTRSRHRTNPRSTRFVLGKADPLSTRQEVAHGVLRSSPKPQHTINIYTFIHARCSLSALEPFFGHFSAARPRLVARLAPSDSPQPRGPCPRAGPPSPRLYAQR